MKIQIYKTSFYDTGEFNPFRYIIKFNGRYKGCAITRWGAKRKIKKLLQIPIEDLKIRLVFEEEKIL